MQCLHRGRRRRSGGEESRKWQGDTERGYHWDQVKDDRVGITNPPIVSLLPLLLLFLLLLPHLYLLEPLSSPNCSTFPIMPHCFCNSKCSTLLLLHCDTPPPHLFQHLPPVDSPNTHTHTQSLASFTLLSRSSLLAALPPLLLLCFFSFSSLLPCSIPLLLSSLCSSSLLTSRTRTPGHVKKHNVVFLSNMHKNTTLSNTRRCEILTCTD